MDRTALAVQYVIGAGLVARGCSWVEGDTVDEFGCAAAAALLAPREAWRPAEGVLLLCFGGRRLGDEKKAAAFALPLWPNRFGPVVEAPPVLRIGTRVVMVWATKNDGAGGMNQNSRVFASGPWNSWVPGVLSWQQVRTLIRDGYIEQGDESRLDNSSLDLTLGEEGYELVHGSLKPRGSRYLHHLRQQGLVTQLSADAQGQFRLTVRKTYLFKLRENIGHLGGSGIFGQATAKSSVGRMDVLARLIVDGMDVYESFDPRTIRSGSMYVEITPMTFNVVVKPEIPLVQLRFFRGKPRQCELEGPELYESVLADAETTDGSLSVDLERVSIGGNLVSAFRVSRMTADAAAIPLWRDEGAAGVDPRPYWHCETADPQERLQIRHNDFYIMRSKEKIHLPRGIAVYCRATDETIGEMRIHYAGFVHPYFGIRKDSSRHGTPLIFEVRGHGVDVTLSQGEKMARLIFYRMSEDTDNFSDEKSYNEQTLKLSKFFGTWPSTFKLDAEGKALPDAK